MEADSLAEFYIDGRAEHTLSTYSAAYKKVVRQGERIVHSVFRWNYREMMGMLMRMSEEVTTENAVMFVCAVVNIIMEVMGLESPTKSLMVLRVKKSVVKTA